MFSEMKPKTVTEYLLWSLVPYTDPNLKLVFKPVRFYDDLERIYAVNKTTLRATMGRALSNGLVERVGGVPMLTDAGMRRIQPLLASRHQRNSVILVVFDIPEDLAHKRRQLRRGLKAAGFIQVQKSVWQTKNNLEDYAKGLAKDLRLQQYVQFFIADKL